MLVKYSCAFVVLPGGFGTLDELFEALTLVQTKKISSFPIVLMGIDYWRPMVNFLEQTLAASGTIDRADLGLFHLTDSADEVQTIIERSVAANTPAWAGRPRRTRILGEK